MKSCVSLYCLWFIILSGYLPGIAQSDSVFTLPEILITSIPLRQDTQLTAAQVWGKKALRDLPTLDIAHLLSQESGVFIKSYGLGSLATSSIRGAGAGHTAVIWNGLPITSPMLGQLDLSLIPLAFIDELTVQYGGNAALWGSGAVGGTIMLRNQTDFETEESVSLGVHHGSFGLQSYHGSWQKSNARVSSDTRFLHQQATNDFPYLIPGTETQAQQTNSGYRRTALLQAWSIRPTPRHQFSLHVWAQDTKREIPPRMDQSGSKAIQHDPFVRLAAHSSHRTTWGTLQSRHGLFREYLTYYDPRSHILSKSDFTRYVSEVEVQHQIGALHRLTGGLSYQGSHAYIRDYIEPVNRHQWALFIQDRMRFGKWRALLSLRQAVVDGRRLPLIPTAELQAPSWSGLTLRGKVAYTYRVPTFNDLYWVPGGNPDLLDEAGWNEEIGLLWNWKTSKIRLRYEATMYNRNIDNWVFWGILPGERFYSAQNLAHVWSRGLSQQLRLVADLPFLTLQGELGYEYTRSTHRNAINLPRVEAGEQLFYVPIHQGNVGINMAYKEFSLSYQHRMVSSVYTLNLEYLDGYQLGSVRANWKWHQSDLEGTLFLALDNAWNQSYQVIERQAMPGRNWQAGLQISFSKR